MLCLSILSVGILADIFEHDGEVKVTEYAMAKLAHERFGGYAIRISDCQIWAGIFYLDSPTNYREFLPQSRERSSMGSEALVIIDERHQHACVPYRFWLVFIPILFLIGYVLYVAFEM
jgi:hypothetical protein